MAYSEDLRLKALAHFDRYQNKTETAKAFGISRQTLINWIKLRDETGGVQHNAGGSRIIKIDQEVLKRIIEKHPDNFLRETAAIFNCSTSCIHYWLAKLNFTRKKRGQLSKNKILKKLNHL